MPRLLSGDTPKPGCAIPYLSDSEGGPVSKLVSENLENTFYKSLQELH